MDNSTNKSEMQESFDKSQGQNDALWVGKTEQAKSKRRSPSGMTNKRAGKDKDDNTSPCVESDRR